MADEPLYQGPDRGYFRVQKLNADSAVALGVTCRIKEATVFNYLSDMQYAIVGYIVEWWPQSEKPPFEGGTPVVYIPANRPTYNKFYFRAKASITNRPLYLEDAIINDFLNNKLTSDPMTLLSFAQVATGQVASAGNWRPLEDSTWEYANAVHITKYEADADTPLTVMQEGITFDYRVKGNSVPTKTQVPDYPFENIRDCYPKMLSHLQGL